MPFSQIQKNLLDSKARAVRSAPPFVHPELNFFNPPADSDPFTVTPNPAPHYPAVGSGPIIVVSFTVPQSQVAIIRKLAIIHFGGNPPDFTGEVIWRVLQNGGGLAGLNNLNAQYGTFAAPKDTTILGYENDTIQVTAECPALLPDGTVNPGPPLGSTTAASFDGWMYPLSQATRPQNGSY